MAAPKAEDSLGSTTGALCRMMRSHVLPTPPAPGGEGPDEGAGREGEGGHRRLSHVIEMRGAHFHVLPTPPAPGAGRKVPSAVEREIEGWTCI